jgi:hypothetical protein
MKYRRTHVRYLFLSLDRLNTVKQVVVVVVVVVDDKHASVQFCRSGCVTSDESWTQFQFSRIVEGDLDLCEDLATQIWRLFVGSRSRPARQNSVVRRAWQQENEGDMLPKLFWNPPISSYRYPIKGSEDVPTFNLLNALWRFNGGRQCQTFLLFRITLRYT